MSYDHDGDMVDCQSLSLSQQLKGGIRMFDMRLKIDSNKHNACNGITISGNCFTLWHGAYYLSATFDDVMNAITLFLKTHPSEFILMRVVHSGGDRTMGNIEQYIKDIPNKMSKSLKNAFKKTKSHGQKLIEKGKQFFSKFRFRRRLPDKKSEFQNLFAAYYNKYSAYIYKGKSNKFISLTVKDIRGKIVMIDDFGARQDFIKWNDKKYFDIQDKYNLCHQGHLYNDKWLRVKRQLDKANKLQKKSGKLYLNFLSAAQDGKQSCIGKAIGMYAGLVYPYFVASGKIGPANWAPQKLVLKTQKDVYPGFPRHCIGNRCLIYFEGINKLAYEYMKTLSNVGIVIMDYPGKGIVNRIIGKNDQFKSNCDTENSIAMYLGLIVAFILGLVVMCIGLGCVCGILVAVSVENVYDKYSCAINEI
eukprot:344604_1